LLKIFKYLFFNVLLIQCVFAETLTWGGYSKIEITKSEAYNMIKEYVEKKYPQKVAIYNRELYKKKQLKIQSVAHSTFVNNGLMWQDMEENKTIYLNQLRAKRYCGRLLLASRKDWRIPTYQELLTLIDYNKADPAAIDAISYLNGKTYWSGSINKHVAKKNGKANWYHVDFSTGVGGYSNGMEKRSVRCVRELSTKKDDY
jgi:hypothetical protein